MEPKRYLWTAVVWSAFILIMCLVSMAGLERIDPLDFEGQDKLMHGIFYFVFTLLWGLYLRSRKGRLYLKSLLIAFCCAVTYGALIEVLQGTVTTNRSADVMDAVANTCGSALAVLLLLMAYRKELENK